VIIHDSRLEGEVPASRASLVVRAGPSTQLADALREASFYAVRTSPGRAEPTERLAFICHGGWLQDSYGLQVAEGLTLANIEEARVLRNRFAKIKVKSGAGGDAAEAHAAELFFARLARVTNTPVYASDRTQLYGPDGFFGLHYDDWEGNLWVYRPDGTRTLAPTSRSDRRPPHKR
jgi:hypothetical protein